MPKTKYFHELSLDKMLEAHDWYYQYSDDNRYYKRGSKENDIIHIRDDKTGIEGNFRIIGKSVDFGPNRYRLKLTINNRPPILAQFLA